MAPDPHIAAIGTALLARVDELGTDLARVIRAEVDLYADPAVVPEAELIRSCTENMRYVFSALRGDVTFDPAPAGDTGTARAVAGVPIAAVLAAYRVGFRYMWEVTVDEIKRRPRMPVDAILAATSQIFLGQDRFTQAMITAYREQQTAQIVDREAERSALVEALLRGQLADAPNLWEAADILRLPTTGPYIVVAAQVPEVGKQALPEIASKLRARDIRSAWRLLPDQQVGVVCLRDDAQLAAIVELFEKLATGRIGVSPAFAGLADTGDALRLARIAMAARSSRAHVTVFDDSPLAMAAANAPDIMRRRFNTTLLGTLRELPDEDRLMLVDTFAAWVDCGGSTNETAAKLFVHPNTVRHRLHRIEERTGKSLSHPRDIAELCLALELDRRGPR